MFSEWNVEEYVAAVAKANTNAQELVSGLQMSCLDKLTSWVSSLQVIGSRPERIKLGNSAWSWKLDTGKYDESWRDEDKLKMAKEHGMLEMTTGRRCVLRLNLT